MHDGFVFALQRSWLTNARPVWITATVRPIALTPNTLSIAPVRLVTQGTASHVQVNNIFLSYDYNFFVSRKIFLLATHCMYTTIFYLCSASALESIGLVIST